MVKEPNGDSGTPTDDLEKSIRLVKESIDNLKGLIELAEKPIAKLKESIKLGNEYIDTLNSQCWDCSKPTPTEISKLKKLLNTARELDVSINSFLLGATSTSLACPFGARKESFKLQKPAWCWMGFLAILALLILVLVGYIFVSYINGDTSASNLDLILEYYLVCLPFIIPIALFAIYAGRHHSRLSRLEEDYAHKEVWLKLFEGYKVQFKYIDPTGKATLNLVAKTLSVLSLPPDRL